MNTIYMIEEEKQSRYYKVKDSGNLLNVARLLHRMESIRESLPKGSRISVLEAMNTQYDFFPIGIRSRLLEPLQGDGGTEAEKLIRSGESQDIFVKIDFDLDSMEVIFNNEEETIQVSVPATVLAKAYKEALRKKNNYQYYVNKNFFSDQLKARAEIKLLSHPERMDQEPKMDL